MLSGQNPYDITNNIVQYYDPNQPTAGLKFFNPPWLLLLIGPICYLPFNTALKVWIATIVIFCLATSLITGKISGLNTNDNLFLCFLSLTFAPFWDTIFWGNISVFIPFGIIGFLWMVQMRRDWLTGPFLVLASLKPHTVFLVGLLIFFWILFNRRFVILASYILTLTILIVTFEKIRPGITTEWIVAAQNGYNHLIAHNSSNISNLIRELFIFFLGINNANYLIIVIPLLTTIVCIFWLIKKKSTLVIQETIIFFIVINLLFTYYSWFHDYSLLLIGLCLFSSQILLSNIPNKKKFYLFAYIIVFNFIALFMMNIHPQYFSHMEWFGIALFVWFYSCSRNFKISLNYK
jgi:hypothetical protein